MRIRTKMKEGYSGTAVSTDPDGEWRPGYKRPVYMRLSNTGWHIFSYLLVLPRELSPRRHLLPVLLGWAVDGVISRRGRGPPQRHRFL